jgi:hypothetical protein
MRSMPRVTLMVVQPAIACPPRVRVTSSGMVLKFPIMA